jgi:AcrR family transcriptional regulator
MTVDASLRSRLGSAGIIGAAATVFARLGFAATRVEDILAAAGIARRTFYKSFSSKEDVLAAVYQLAIQELLGAMNLAAGRGKDPFDVIRAGLDVYLDYHAVNARLVRVLVEQAIRSDSPIFPARRRFRAELARLLDDAVHAKTGKRHDPLLYAALLSALEGLSLELLSGGATEIDGKEVARAKKVMHLLVQRVLETRSA